MKKLSYKMMTDGTGQARIADYAELQEIRDNWIYYSYDYVHHMTEQQISL